MAAEGPLHELGAISIINSDSQGMGRIGETVRRTFQLAHVMKAWRRTGAADGVAGLPADPGLDDPDDRDDTARVLRYLAKVTIEPAITHGIAGHVGSLQAGPAGRHRAVEARVLRRQARVGVQGRVPGLGPAGRGQRVRRARGADPLSARTGAASSAAAPKVAVTFVSSGVGSRRRSRAAGHAADAAAGGRVRGITPASLAREPRRPAGRHRHPDGGRVARGTRLAVEPVDEVPLSRRYLLR